MIGPDGGDFVVELLQVRFNRRIEFGVFQLSPLGIETGKNSIGVLDTLWVDMLGPKSFDFVLEFLKVVCDTQWVCRTR